MVNRLEYIKKLREFGLQNEIPNITDNNAMFLRNLIKIQKTKNMLEIGSANGFSAIQFGIELEKLGAKLTTIEFSEPSQKQTLENLAATGLENTVNSIRANALYEIPKLKEFYDFVFIDAMKRRTKDFFDLVYDKVKLGGIIVVDDVIKFRDKMGDFWDYLNKNNLEYSLIPIDGDDGILLMIKSRDKLVFRLNKDY